MAIAATMQAFDSTEGSTSGSTVSRKARAFEAPSVRAACAGRRSRLANTGYSDSATRGIR
ncbi:hypothetical protein D3C74_502860 [compost metagenome]